MDESFVMEHIGDQITEEEKELMGLFVKQSQDQKEVDVVVEAGEERKVKGFYRICDIPPKQCDDSPLQDIEHPERITGKKNSVFGYEGQMIQTDGTGRRTKLTKVYKVRFE